MLLKQIEKEKINIIKIIPLIKKQVIKNKEEEIVTNRDLNNSSNIKVHRNQVNIKKMKIMEEPDKEANNMKIILIGALIKIDVVYIYK